MRNNFRRVHNPVVHVDILKKEQTMGNTLHGWLWEKPKKHKILIQGLDASGKTTILYRLNWDDVGDGGKQEVVDTIPTIGFNVESLTLRGYEFTAWDLGGRGKMKTLWKHYYFDTDGLIFVVDSNDTDRTDQARDEFQQMLHEEELKGLPVLLLCNKQELPNAWSPEKIRSFFEVSIIQNPVVVLGCVATKNEGLKQGLEWLRYEMSKDKQKSPPPADRPVSANEEVKSELPVLDYDPTLKGNNFTLQRFQPIQKASCCPFAKAAVLWGGKSFPNPTSLKEQARVHAPALHEFVKQVRGERAPEPGYKRLDGFCIELDDEVARGDRPEDLGACVKDLLMGLSELDPAGEHVMRKSYIGARGWNFRFDRMDFFVTTFAPCYPTTSSRFAYGVGRAFVLLQPEISFDRHKLPDDTPHTQWDKPETIRDMARVNFRKAGQSYWIPPTVSYPMAEHIVKPLQDDGDTVVRWWQLDKKERVH